MDPPFAFRTALILHSIISTCWKQSLEILVHIDMIATRSCCQFVGHTSICHSIPHYSIGLSSGDCERHWSRVNSWYKAGRVDVFMFTPNSHKFWHKKPCHVQMQINPLFPSSPFWCSIWTLETGLDPYLQMLIDWLAVCVKKQLNSCTS